MQRFARSWLGAAVLCASPGLCTAASAELFRCNGPDGRTIYTDDKSVCPAAKPYQPDAVVHTVDPAPQDDAQDERTERAALRRQAHEDEQSQAQIWRDLKRAKEDELRKITAERDDLLPYVNWCDGGGTVSQRDELGIQRNQPCSVIYQRRKTLDQRVAALRQYIEHDLAEECRRAGCLPGWIR